MEKMKNIRRNDIQPSYERTRLVREGRYRVDGQHSPFTYSVLREIKEYKSHDRAKIYLNSDSYTGNPDYFRPRIPSCLSFN